LARNPTRFTDPVAVDVWDACFRWRVGSELRDRTIDATWARVSSAVAAVEGAHAGTWARRYAEAFSDWRLLPDERLLRTAGTAVALERFDRPCATLNAGAFVRHPHSPQASFDHVCFAAIAALAVRLLDDAHLAIDGPARTPPDLHVGMMGVADALAAMGLRYASGQAQQMAATIATSLAQGCLQGTVELARERGAREDQRQSRFEAWDQRGMPAALMDDARRYGMRHARLTAIEPQPRLALLANNISDALDPVCTHAGDGFTPLTGGAPARAVGIATDRLLCAQIELRGAVQPWIDAPISCPLVFGDDPPDTGLVDSCQRLASERGLPPPSFRKAETRIAADDFF
jgi:ribonucleoside-diphosphate reductase alpha chain